MRSDLPWGSAAAADTWEAGPGGPPRAGRDPAFSRLSITERNGSNCLSLPIPCWSPADGGSGQPALAGCPFPRNLPSLLNLSPDPNLCPDPKFLFEILSPHGPGCVGIHLRNDVRPRLIGIGLRNWRVQWVGIRIGRREMRVARARGPAQPLPSGFQMFPSS